MRAEDAARILGPSIGKQIGADVRKVTLRAGDPAIHVIAAEDRAAESSRGFGVYFSTSIERRYSSKELGAAELLQIEPTSVFEPAGEDCDTRYDDTVACTHCGFGRVQLTPLSLDLRRSQPEHDIDTQVMPRQRDISRTIAHEYVVSDRLAALLRDGTGAELDPVVRCHRSTVIPGWSQLTVVSESVEVISPPTRYGTDSFDPDEAGKYRCPLGHVLGLNLLSELTIARSSWHREDFVRTRQASGHRMGLLVPAPELLISARLYRTLEAAGIRGLRYSVVHLA